MSGVENHEVSPEDFVSTVTDAMQLLYGDVQSFYSGEQRGAQLAYADGERIAHSGQWDIDSVLQDAQGPGTPKEKLAYILAYVATTEKLDRSGGEAE